MLNGMAHQLTALLLWQYKSSYALLQVTFPAKLFLVLFSVKSLIPTQVESCKFKRRLKANSMGISKIRAIVLD